MNNKILPLFIFVFSVISVTELHAANGVPFNELQDQINALQTQVDELEAQIDGLSQGGPVEVTVNCVSDSISNTLNTYKDNPGSLTINVNGTCVENVVMNRNNVTLKGPGALRAQSIATDALLISGQIGIRIENLNIQSAVYPAMPDGVVLGGRGVEIENNSSVVMKSVSFASFDIAVFVKEEGSLVIDSSTISGNAQGLLVARNALARFSNMQITNSFVGLEAREGGRLQMGEENINSTISGSSIVPGTSIGIRISRGGAGRFNSGILTISNNENSGIRLEGFGLLEGGEGVTITGNARGLDCRRPFTLTREVLNDIGAFRSLASITGNTLNIATTCN